MKGLIAALFLTLAIPSGAQTVIIATAAPSAYSVVPASVTFVTSDNVNGTSFAHTGSEILIVNNTDAASQTVTVKSVADLTGRLGDTTKLMNPGSFYVFQLFPVQGWRQTNGTILINTTSANVKLAVIRLP